MNTTLSIICFLVIWLAFREWERMDIERMARKYERDREKRHQQALDQQKRRERDQARLQELEAWRDRGWRRTWQRRPNKQTD